MNIKGIVASLLCVSVINSLYATPLFKNIMRPKASITTHQNAQKNQSNQVYTDFSGTWVSSKCMGGPLTLKIENSPTDLILNDGDSVEIGTLITKSSSGIKTLSSVKAENDTSSVEWNENKTQLIFKSVSINKIFSDEINQDVPLDTHMYLTMTHAVLELDNEQLKLKWDIAEYKDLQRIDLSHPTCTFTKSE